MSNLYELEDVTAELDRQDARFGDQSHLPDGTSNSPFNEQQLSDARARFAEAERLGLLTFAHILEEEYWEAINEIDPAKLRTELIQVAAVALQWVRALDKRGAR